MLSDPYIVGSSWKLFDYETSCSDTCDGTCQLCLSPMHEYTSEQYCGFLTNPVGPFSPCHHLVFPQKYYSLCMENLCVAEGQRWALCDALWAYDAACKKAGGIVDLWTNATGCARSSALAKQCSAPDTVRKVASVILDSFTMAVPVYRQSSVAAYRTGEGLMSEASESKLLLNCTVNCTFGPPLVCEQYSCPAKHSCRVSDGIMGRHKDAGQNADPCAGKCDETEKCHLSSGVPVCGSRRGLCWTYHTFDGLNYDFEGTCTYLLAASKGAACGLTTGDGVKCSWIKKVRWPTVVGESILIPSMKVVLSTTCIMKGQKLLFTRPYIHILLFVKKVE